MLFSVVAAMLSRPVTAISFSYLRSYRCRRPPAHEPGGAYRGKCQFRSCVPPNIVVQKQMQVEQGARPGKIRPHRLPPQYCAACSVSAFWSPVHAAVMYAKVASMVSSFLFLANRGPIPPPLPVGRGNGSKGIYIPVVSTITAQPGKAAGRASPPRRWRGATL